MSQNYEFVDMMLESFSRHEMIYLGNFVCILLTFCILSTFFSWSTMKPHVIIKSIIIFAVFQLCFCLEKVSIRAGQYTQTHSQANAIILIIYKTILHPMPLSFLTSAHPGNYNDDFQSLWIYYMTGKRKAPSCTNSIVTRNHRCNFPDWQFKTENGIGCRIVLFITHLRGYAFWYNVLPQ